MKKPGKIEIISLIIFVLLQSIVFFYWGNSVRPYIKHVFIKTFSFAATTADAHLVERSVFQLLQSLPDGPRSSYSVPHYRLVNIYEFEAGNKTIRSADAKNISLGFPAKTIAEANREMGSSHIAFHILDTAFKMSDGLPWFMTNREYSDTSKTDAAFATLMREGGFVAKPINKKVTYLRFAPYNNSLEALPLNEANVGPVLGLLPILMAAALIFPLWNMVIRKELGYSVFASVGSWVAVLLLIFIVAPLRPQEIDFKRREYLFSIVIDQTFAGKIMSELASTKK